MSPIDGAGLFGVAIILIAYAAATLGRLNPEGAPSLAINFVGASLILLSLLTQSFNLSAAVMEGSWALVALIGLARLAVKRLVLLPSREKVSAQPTDEGASPPPRASARRAPR